MRAQAQAQVQVLQELESSMAGAAEPDSRACARHARWKLALCLPTLFRPAADEEEAAEMAAAEQHILKSLGWKGQGLINLAGRGDDVHGDEGGSGGGGGGGSGDGGSRGG